ncbi:hypothetical protein JCM5350_002078 [Sporobolomyces pararoseus]
MTSPPPSLLTYISTELSKTFPTEHSRFKLSCIRSQPRRSYALFPHATNHKSCKIWQEEVLCLLNVEREAIVDEETKEKDKGKQKQQEEENSTTRTETGEIKMVKGYVPLCAIEASIYTIPSTRTSILYISKIDTTGLQQQPSSSSSLSPSPNKTFISCFISYHFNYLPHSTIRLRLHIFAKSQPQYLFPGSIENSPPVGKKVLDDKQLLKWWKSTLTSSIPASTGTRVIKKFYSIAGLNYLESLPYLPSTSTSSGDWIYGHPYSTLSSPLHNPSTSSSSKPSDHPITDQIPSFPDDPKSRFLHSLTSSALSPSGTEGDYDDVHYNLSHLIFSSGNNPQQRREEIETERERERTRLIKSVEEGGVEEWWERLQFRQECCSGVLVGFFVISSEEEEIDIPTEGRGDGATNAGTSSNNSAPKGYPSSLPHGVFTKLWTQIHNLDYSLKSLNTLIPAVSKWFSDVERLVKLEIEKEGSTIESGLDETEKFVEIRNRELVEKLRKEKEDLKRKSEEEEKAGGQAKKVNTLAPRKKKKT